MTKAKTIEVTVEEKLRALYDLQIIDKRIDEIRSVRGELPLEVEDLEDEIAGLQTRVTNFENEVADMEREISEKKLAMKESLVKITKYEEQQKNVRNNREFDAITKEIEFQQLEIELATKRIKEHQSRIENKKEVIAQSQERLDERTSHLNFKRAELDGILAETQKEEEALIAKSLELKTEIEPRLVAAYDRIRNNTANGLAVVSIERGASAGSYFVIPPQRQLEIAQRKKIIIDEHSGRILVDPILAAEEEEKMAAMIRGWVK